MLSLFYFAVSVVQGMLREVPSWGADLVVKRPGDGPDPWRTMGNMSPTTVEQKEYSSLNNS